MFKTKPKTLKMVMPEGYSFEFSFETDLKSQHWEPMTDRRWAKMEWNLFYHFKHVATGTNQYRMDEDNMEEKVFMFARRRALRDAENRKAKDKFPYKPGVVYSLNGGASAEIDENVRNAYDY